MAGGARSAPDAKLLEQHPAGVRAGGRGLREVPRAVSELEKHLRVLVLRTPRRCTTRGASATAATQYEKVRDSKLDNKYVEDAAFNAVKSYERRSSSCRQQGASTTSRRCRPSARPQTPVTPMQIPELVDEAAEGVRRVRAARARLGARADDDATRRPRFRCKLSALGRGAPAHGGRSSASTARTTSAPTRATRSS